jgi:AAT family amino acid transporter/D-serine/D-alanine/glycine transporter
LPGISKIGRGEAQNPEKPVPSAINKVIWRVLIFYVGALLVSMSLVAWNRLDQPVCQGVRSGRRARRRRGRQLRGADRCAVVLQQRHLQHRPDALHPGRLPAGARRPARGEPAESPDPWRLVVSFAAMLVGVVLNYFVSERAFTYITSARAAAPVPTAAGAGSYPAD